MPDGTASLELAGACLTALLCFDDLGGAVAAAERGAGGAAAGGAARARRSSALTAWHEWLLGDLRRGGAAEPRAWAGAGAARVAARDVGAPARRSTRRRRRRHGLAAARRVPPAPRCSRSSRPSAGTSPAAAAHADAAVAARDAGPLRGAPHALPVTCAAARRADPAAATPDAAVARCIAGLELARGWRDISLMVPATLLELSARARRRRRRGRRRAATRAAAHARVAGARDAGVLAGSRPSLRAVDGVDELSAREIEVLEALGRPGSLREVADQLFISRNTIKTHTRALYGKLGVASRDEAVSEGPRARPAPGGDAMTLADCTVMVVEDHEFQRQHDAADARQPRRRRAAGGRRRRRRARAASARPTSSSATSTCPAWTASSSCATSSQTRAGTAIVIASGLDESVLRSAELTARGFGLEVLGAIRKPLTARRLLEAVGLHRPPAPSAARARGSEIEVTRGRLADGRVTAAELRGATPGRRPRAGRAPRARDGGTRTGA